MVCVISTENRSVKAVRQILITTHHPPLLSQPCSRHHRQISQCDVAACSTALSICTPHECMHGKVHEAPGPNMSCRALDCIAALWRRTRTALVCENPSVLLQVCDSELTIEKVKLIDESYHETKTLSSFKSCSNVPSAGRPVEPWAGSVLTWGCSHSVWKCNRKRHHD